MRIKQLITLVVVLLILNALVSNMACAVPALSEFGGVENVQISPENLQLRAKLDTGADHCSLGVSEFEYFMKDQKSWVRFSIRSRKGDEKTFERPVITIALIKGESSRLEKRPVIELGICIGSLYKISKVNLNNRSGFAYPMLIGRDFISGNVVVNPAKGYTSVPECKIPSNTKEKHKKHK